MKSSIGLFYYISSWVDFHWTLSLIIILISDGSPNLGLNEKISGRLSIFIYIGNKANESRIQLLICHLAHLWLVLYIINWPNIIMWIKESFYYKLKYLIMIINQMNDVYTSSIHLINNRSLHIHANPCSLQWRYLQTTWVSRDLVTDEI
jgi:hypothetical protein